MEPAIDSTVSRHLVVTVHGIRTFGHWQERLESALADAARTVGQSVNVVNYKFGYFSAFALLSITLRFLAVRRFQRELLALVSKDWDRIDIVAHSFGTYLVAKALLSWSRTSVVRVNTVILAGSVLPARFNWSALLPTTIRRVVNDCGARDNVLWISQLIPMLGMAGRTGFLGMTGQELRNRFFSFGHSGYFLDKGASSNGFMVDRWIPLLLNVAPIDPVDQRSTSWLTPVETFLLKNAKPTKLIGYAATILILVTVITPRVARLYAMRTISSAGGLVHLDEDGLSATFDSNTNPGAAVKWLRTIGPIHTLDLAETNFNDKDLLGLPANKDLAKIDLTDTEVTGDGLKHLVDFPGLVELTLSNTHPGSLVSLPALPRLRLLSLQGAVVRDDDLAWIGKLTTLEELDLSDTGITGSGFSYFGNLFSLRRLLLSGTHLNDSGLKRLPPLPKLQDLAIERVASLKGSGFTSVANQLSLEVLSVKDSGVDSSAFRDFSRLTKLRYIAAPGTAISSEAVPILARLPKLQKLYIGGTLIKDRDLHTLSGAPTLEVLWVPANPQLTDTGLKYLVAARPLKELNVSATNTSESERANFKRLRPDVHLLANSIPPK